jgi:polyhydroxybutyrate depolymerase
MAYRLGCELSDRITAIAPNAGGLTVSTCAPARAVPLLHMHSKLDTNVPYLGGVGTGLSNVNWPSLQSTLSRWSTLGGCTNPPQVDTVAGAYTRELWFTCNAGMRIESYLTEDGGHAWPGGLPSFAGGDTPSTAIDANDTLIAFFRRFALP